MRYFVVSDIHGHYRALREALADHGFDPTKDDHHLLVLGDMFDRGTQSNEVLEYLYPLTLQDKCTVLLGNHDSFLLDFLKGDDSRVMFNIMFNGFGQTLWSLSGIEPKAENIDDLRNVIDERHPYLLNWLKSLPYYLEIGDYVFVHGGIDGSKLDWRQMSSRRDFIWSRQHELPGIPGKTVVAGHTRVPTIRKRTDDYKMLFLHSPEYFDILHLDGKILIDRYVEVSDEINVLELDIETP